MSTGTRSNDTHQSNSNTVSDTSARTGQPVAGSAELTGREGERTQTNKSHCERRLRCQIFASFFEQLYLEKEVYAHEDRIVLRWPRKLDAPADYNARLQRINGRIYAEADGKEGDSGDRILAQALSIPDGEYELILMPSTNEYYIQGVRVQRKIPLSVVRSDYRTDPYGTYVERQIELLRHAIACDDGLFSEIAKMTLGWWKRVNTKHIAAAIDAVAGYEENCLTRLIGLLGMASRYAENEAFPVEIRQPLDGCLTGFAYSDSDVVGCAPARTGRAGAGGVTERLLRSVCELLAGQRFPEYTFPCSNQSGRWHRERGEEAIVRWLQQAATDGFPDTSSQGMARLLIAVSHLVDLADSAQIWDLATVVMDKALVTLALDSFEGVYGASAGHDAASVRSGYVSPLAGIARLLWGIGAWNQHLAAPVSLACCQSYEQPRLIAGLSADRPADMWASERQLQWPVISGQRPAAPGTGVYKAIYKTADYLLCSASDFQPGQRGGDEQISLDAPLLERGAWQAILGVDAIVFVNHPAGTAASDTPREDDYWRSGLLPRVAQRRDLLIALYLLPRGEPCRFTRAYFPIFAFDEHQVGTEWAFAAKGDAYIALACSRPIALTQDGVGAYRELRAYTQPPCDQGPGTSTTDHRPPATAVAWLCQMGRKDDYGSFANFRKRILAARFSCDGLSVSYRPLQGDRVSFDWNGPLRVNGAAQSLDSANHYEGPHCATDGWPASQMVVVYGEQAIQLDFNPSG